MRGSHCVKTWASTQKSVTLSSGEAELVAAVKMSGELIGMCQLSYDWGVEMGARLLVDSSAAIGVVNRKVNGRLSHVRVGMLWIQEKVEDGAVSVQKVLGTENPADLMTKNLAASALEKYMKMLTQEGRDGRAEKSLTLVKMEEEKKT
mgnify:CR=1 FL=1